MRSCHFLLLLTLILSRLIVGCSTHTHSQLRSLKAQCFASCIPGTQDCLKPTHCPKYQTLLHMYAGSVDSKLSSAAPPLPETKASILSRLTFHWARDLIDKGNEKPLQMEDVWELDADKRMSNISVTFQATLSQQQLKSREKESTYASRNIRKPPIGFLNAPLSLAVWTMFRRQFILSGLLKGFNTMVQFFPAVLISRFLRLVESGGCSPSDISKGLTLSLMLVFVLALKTIVENQYFHIISKLGMFARSAISCAVYRKSLVLSPAARQAANVGELVNYMQLDASRIENVATSVHILWDGIFQIIGFTSLLYWYLGPSVFAGILTMLVLVPVNTVCFKRLSKLRQEMLTNTDARVKLSNEVLQGMYAIKSYSWEEPFRKILTGLRNKEMGALERSTITRSLLVAALSAAPSLVAVVTFAVYALTGNPLTPSRVFTALSLFNQLRFPLIFYPMVINNLAEGKVSLERLTSYLNAEEIDLYIERPPLVTGAQSLTGCSESAVAVSVKDGCFSWATQPLMSEAPVSDSTLQSRESKTGGGRLINLNLEVKQKQLLAVVGPVGSGKSTLLNALLGELRKDSGRIQVCGSVAYVPQGAWIPHNTFKDSILFGNEYDERRYKETLRVCGLEADLKNLEYGDQTEIGERGVNLSGGQKQRISLARAVYEDSDVYLLDDPLSALDAGVGKQVFEQCIKGTLANKTVVMVTNQLSYLPVCDEIVLMETDPQGACYMVDRGNYTYMVGKGYDFVSIIDTNANTNTVPQAEGQGLKQTQTPSNKKMGILTSIPANFTAEVLTSSREIHKQDETPILHVKSFPGNMTDACPPTGGHVDCFSDETSESNNDLDEPFLMHPHKFTHLSDTGELVEDNTRPTTQPRSPVPKELRNPLSSLTGKNSAKDASLLGLHSLPEAILQSPPAVNRKTLAAPKLIQAEDRAEGAVGWIMYKKYLMSVRSPVLLFLTLLCYVLANATQLGQQWAVARWTNDPTYKMHTLGHYLGGIALMAACVSFFNFLRAYYNCVAGIRASLSLHSNMLNSLLRAPLGFFESTPTGRLVQRLSKDLDQIDQNLPGTFGMLLNAILSIIAAGIAIGVTSPPFIFASVPIGFIYVTITNRFRSVARELKRLDSISRSPVYSHFGETLGGLPIIRTFNRAKAFQESNEQKIDANLKIYYALKSVDRWLSVRLETLGNVIVFLSAVFVSIFSTGSGRAGAAGLSLTNALSITSLLSWAVRNAAECESMMNSVERVLYTTEETPKEGQTATPYRPIVPGPYASDEELRTSGWPWRGGVQFNNVTMRYREDFPAVLKQVSLSFMPGERVGIVGRTGSGKSSLFRALLRFNEVTDGRIEIDGVDIRTLALDTLRSGISIIPQEPVLFSGSIRLNIDPFNANTDRELWEALAKVNLASLVEAMPNGLNELVTENGDNLSAGQRQLICLVRALVRRSRVLLLDEATSSVDPDTDALIQATIRKEFKDCTVLVIAHRLNTILDSDKIIVMRDGSVGEVGHPLTLLRTKSLFRQLWMQQKDQRQTDAHAHTLDSEEEPGTTSSFSTPDVAEAASVMQELELSLASRGGRIVQNATQQIL